MKYNFVAPLSKRMHFRNDFFFVRVAANHRHVVCKRDRWKIPGHMVSDVFIFMLPYSI